jgi:hypothetical protein
MSANQAQLMPFRKETRQNRQKVAAIAYAAASALTPQEMPRVGMLSRIYVQFRGTVTLSGAGALSDLGPWNLISRIQVNANIGAAAILDLTGYGAYLESCVLDRAFRPDVAGAGLTTADADIYSAPVASGANTWVLTWVLPIGANQGSNFEAGLINLQAPEVRVTVNITTGQLTDPAALCTAITGNFQVYYEYYEIPDPRRAALPPLMVVRTLEEKQAISTVGDNLYVCPRQGNLLHLIDWVQLNSVRNSASIDSLAVRFNKTTTVYNMERQLMRLVNRLHTSTDLPTGVFLWDMWHAGESMSTGDGRDTIDTEDLSTLEFITTVNSGATLGGAGTNNLNSIRRITQVFQP